MPLLKRWSDKIMTNKFPKRRLKLPVDGNTKTPSHGSGKANTIKLNANTNREPRKKWQAQAMEAILSLGKCVNFLQSLWQQSQKKMRRM